MKIIGLSGGMGVGKSTAIEIIKEMYPDSPVFLVKFAQPLYDMQEMIYDRISSVYTRPTNFTKDRKLLQWLGTDWGRDTIRQDLWVVLWKAEVLAISREYMDAIIMCDDCRFDNEAEAIKSVGGCVIKIIRPDNVSHAQGGEGIKGHKSEAGVSENFLDFTVHNDDTVAAFREKLTACFREIYKPVLLGQKE